MSKRGGRLHIWDTDILCASPELFIVDLDVRLYDEIVHARYGVVNDIRNQTLDSISTLCIEKWRDIARKEG